MLSAGASVSLKGGVLTISTNNLDAEYEYYDEDGKMITTTYRNAGFTKYEVKMTFKK
jgi:molybdopterin biosynthesis enzyme MoaB